jgi:hypothetical protein
MRRNMIKMSLRHPSGLEIEFEGDEPAFDRFAQFLAGELSGFVRGLEPVNTEDIRTLPPGDVEDDGDSAGNIAEQEVLSLANGNGINPHTVAQLIDRIGAKSDIDRVTVIAHAALEAGLEGIDYMMIEKLYDDMGFPKPARFAKAFSNAKARGLVKSVKHGVWAPTVQGENYARYGQKPTRRTQKRPSVPSNRPSSAEAPALAAGFTESE